MISLFKVLMSPRAKDLVASVLESGHVAQGPMVDKLEGELKILLASGQDPLLVNSGTSALHLAYHVAGIRRGDVVAVTPMTCAATITPLVELGAVPVWIDVDPVTGLIDPDAIRIAKIARAVVAVDWAGTPAPYDQLRSVVPFEIPIIEDAAHAMLATRGGRSIASYAAEQNLFLCWSLQAIKHLNTGDGGVLVCPTTEATERARKLRWFGFDRRSSTDFRCAQDITESGYKFHMNDIAAAIGLANIPLVQQAVGRHRTNAHRYCDELAGLERVVVPPWNHGSSWWIYTITVDDRASFEAYMKEHGVATSQVHRRNDEHTAFRKIAYDDPVLPGLDHFASRQVSIPVGWWLSHDDVDHIIASVRTWATS